MEHAQRVSLQFLVYWGRGERWNDPRVYARKFYARVGRLWVAIDNCGGEWFVEEFKRMKDAIAWLNDPEGRTGDQWKEDNGK